MVRRISERAGGPRRVDTCPGCLAWGWSSYARGICVPCYNFARPALGHEIGVCTACSRRQPLKDAYCRLCWCQARLDRQALARSSRDAIVLAPYLRDIRHQQLFLAITDARTAPPQASRRGRRDRGRAFAAAPMTRPGATFIQPALFAPGPRTYRRGVFDLRSDPVPDNPWLEWGLHLAETMAEARGWSKTARQAMRRTLVVLLAGHASGERIRVSDFRELTAELYTNLDALIEILTVMDVIDDDRPKAIESWLERRVEKLTPAFRREVLTWARLLRDGGPRSRPRRPHTVQHYVNAVVPAILSWSDRYEHLREVTHDDVVDYLRTLQGHPRLIAITALRALFGWAKRANIVFRNPAGRLSKTTRPARIWQPLPPEQVAGSLVAVTAPQHRLAVILAAVHAARPGQIRALCLNDVDLPRRRSTIGGLSRPLDDLIHQELLAWLTYRSRRWPRTANPHLLINQTTAVAVGPIGAAYIGEALRRVAAGLEQLRIDRQLDEALASGGDPLHLAAMFGISPHSAVRYATSARQLFE